MSITKNDSALSRENYYTIGEISRLYHIGIDTLRYYEEKGIIEPVRGENGYRYYSNQTIWRMNVITNLRSLGFSVERIRGYFTNRTVETTMALLDEELGLVAAKMRELRALQKAIRQQLATLEQAEALEPGLIKTQHFGPRRAFRIMKAHSSDEDMDLLMKKLLEKSGAKNYMIGNNRLASLVADEHCTNIYEGAIILDERGDCLLPAGEYLSLCYRGRSDSRRHMLTLKDYARRNGIRLQPPFLDLVWIDIHTAADVCEHLSEVQIRIDG